MRKGLLIEEWWDFWEKIEVRGEWEEGEQGFSLKSSGTRDRNQILDEVNPPSTARLKYIVEMCNIDGREVGIDHEMEVVMRGWGTVSLRTQPTIAARTLREILHPQQAWSWLLSYVIFLGERLK